SLQGDLVHFKVDFKLQDMVVSSPTTAFIYLFGMAISELIYYLPGIAVLLAMAFINLKFGLFPTLQVTGAMILMFVLATALGFMLSTHISDIMESWAVTGVVSILLSTIPPVYYPITYIPLPYRYAAYLSPTTYAAQIAQQAMGYIHFPQVTIDIDWIVLIGVSVVLLLISVKKTRWREI
ncbi:MAG: ABC transporter permease, partial [Nitrososphaerota archaeon]|nr:ABC transporter permease [Nitrososphaerota archaeon]